MKNVISATVIALFALTAQAQTAPAASPAVPAAKPMPATVTATKPAAAPAAAAPAAPAPAAAPAADAKEPTKQQNKMKTCNADAKTKELKGDERKAFMSECLSANKQEKQQDKM